MYTKLIRLNRDQGEQEISLEDLMTMKFFLILQALIFDLMLMTTVVTS